MITANRPAAAKTCIELGCDNPAGTRWSPHWCESCNRERMDRIEAGLEETLARLKAREVSDG